MPIRNLLRLALFCVLASLLVMPSLHAVAQSEPVQLDPLTRAQFASVPLTTEELPNGYVLQGETFVAADQFAPGGDTSITGQTLVDAGFSAVYSSVYAHESGDGQITSYVSLWNSFDEATVGFELLEDEAVNAPGSDVVDTELNVGEGLAELTTGTVDVDGVQQQYADATLVVETLVVGVTSRGSADAVVDREGMIALAEALEDRASTVTGGEIPEGTDFGLATSTLNISQLGTELQAGFLSPVEAEALYGLSGSSLGNLNDAWVSLVAIGEGASPPFVVVGRTSFVDAETAAQVVEQSAELVPLAVALEPVDGFAVDGVGELRGFTYVSPTSPDAPGPNSFRAVAQVDTFVIIVDVQGATSVEEARTAATALLTAQLACNNESCELPDLSIGS